MSAFFVAGICPLSVQAKKKKEEYKDLLRTEFNNLDIAFPGTPYSTPLYSKVIYFYKNRTNIDVMQTVFLRHLKLLWM